MNISTGTNEAAKRLEKLTRWDSQTSQCETASVAQQLHYPEDRCYPMAHSNRHLMRFQFALFGIRGNLDYTPPLRGHD